MGKLSEAETKKVLAKIEEYKKQSQKKRRKQGRPALYEDFMREPVGQKEADRYRSAVKVLDTEYKLGMTGYPKPRGVKKPKPKSKQEGGFLAGAKEFFTGSGKLFGITPTKPKSVVGKGGADQFGKIVKKKSVKEQAAQKRKDFFKGKAFAAGPTEGNIAKAGKQPEGRKVGTRTGAAKDQFPKTKGAYTIKKGDTLSSIAKARGTTVAAILKANPGIKDKNKIRAGAGLKGIPGIQGSSTISNIAKAGKQPKGAGVGTKYGELYKGKGKKKASGKVRAGRGTTGDKGSQTETATKKKTTPGLKGRKQRREKRNFNLGGMASMSSMDDYMKDLL